MANPKGNPNIAEYGKETRFGTAGRGCSAVDAGALGNKSQARTREIMNLIAEKLPDGASDVLVEKMMAGDLAAWRLWFEYTTEKPKETLSVESDGIEIHFNAV